MYLYVIRHGQTDWNLNKKLLSVTDIPLNETGIEQCKEAEKLVKNLNYNLVFCSPKTRTKETMEIVNTKSIPVIYDDRLIERDAKSLEGINTEDFNYRDFWTLGKDKIQDCETIEECKTRVYEFLDEIKEKYKDKNILIVTHNGICRLIHTYFNGFPKKGDISQKGHLNAEIKMYEIKNKDA
ncbi:MAG: histidine phosphatase family protein [Clostridia bacterium]|nr:histidine phosphatase family protein [Clostridia bacterium]